ncbi:hypothetical protein [uncultured Hymenobacter sp.]|uniref:hypothetical protein n=1 Tax=uncultured Hymenobacter sp. TaxID=170016 RepID=UPI0035CB8805
MLSACTKASSRVIRKHSALTASASLERIQPKQMASTSMPYVADTVPDSRQAPPPTLVVSAPVTQLPNLATRQAKCATQEGVPGAKHPKARLRSNKTPYSRCGSSFFN